ncbi:hypothetical protein IKL64_08845 [bacterium]|nr:hypothetical protein [bacterium]
MEISNNYNINFGAKFGPNLRATLLKSDFGGSKQKLNELEDTFSKNFEEWIEENTVLELRNNGKFELSNPAFPKYKVIFNLVSSAKTLSEKLLNAHYLNFNYNECKLFKQIISKEVKKGKTLEELKAIAETKLVAGQRREYFKDFLEYAQRIKAENPESELTELEFSQMGDRILREILANESNGIMARLSKK